MDVLANIGTNLSVYMLHVCFADAVPHFSFVYVVLCNSIRMCTLVHLTLCVHYEMIIPFILESRAD